ncbi:tetratricopeptide repeat protein [Actinoplanes regularis]|uniref:Tetratricopeptide repeat-containing protein n=1 Tax=Actinoplanes regularis TaxID=52697 RepID=A0A239FZT9_9ACTN|nr:tetratricopeptide repeat protein [Actinoplanes regularis]GIE90082.1 tetratricopeptide repeat protein [Actinoplanes regularis]SNS61802.1 Tetratricopeptide repeat-containing protein [Actinoplanes regularis]
MNRRHRRWTPSPGTVIVLTAAFALVGNLATDTLEVSWRWWPATVWAAAALLVVLSVAVEVLRQRSATRVTPHAVGSGRRVFGAIPRPAWHVQARSAEEATLRRALGRRNRAALVVLTGTRGAGKSQLAAAYARRRAASFDLVAWINAEGGPVPGMALLAGELGLVDDAERGPEAAARALRGWLENDSRQRLLLIFDNVDGPDSLAGHLPVAGSAKVLITSNRLDFASMPGVTVVPVGMFTRSQCQAFLHQATGLPGGADADEVARQLGRLPLGLAQAAAYIRRGRISYRQYLTALDGPDLREALRRPAGADHPGVIKATRLSIAALRRIDRGGDAVRLLTLLSLLSPDGVSRVLLRRAAPALRLRNGLDRALGLLTDGTLITLSGEVHDGEVDRVVVSVHRLTARVVRHQAGRSGIAALAAATGMLGTLTGEPPLQRVARRRSELVELVAHVLALRKHTADPSSSLLTLVAWAGVALHEVGDLGRAVPLLEATLTGLEQAQGADHPDTITTRGSLALAYESAGRLDEAVGLLERVVADQARTRGDDHPYTLVVRRDLAHAYESAGRLAEAVDLFEQVLADSVRTGHPDTLGSRDYLAAAYHSAGRLDEAIDMFQRLVVDCDRVLGAEHPDTVGSRANLAATYRSAGRTAEAIDLLQHVIAVRTRVLGPDHPHTLYSRAELADVYRSAGRLDESIDLFERVISDVERVLGAGHPRFEKSREALKLARDAAKS